MNDALPKIEGNAEALKKNQADQEANARAIKALQDSLKSRSISLPGTEDLKLGEDYSFVRIALALDMAPKLGVHPSKIAPKEWDVSQQSRKANAAEMDRRDMLKQANLDAAAIDAEERGVETRTTATVGTPSLGGFLVPNQISQKIYELLYAQLVLRDLGATIMTNIVGDPFEVPLIATGSTGYWIGEEGAATESNLTFGSRKFSPKEFATTCAISKRALRFTNPMIEAVYMREIAMQMAIGIEQASLIGKGSEFQPQGILKGAGGSGTNYPYLQGALSSDHVGTDVNLGTDGGAMTFVNALSFIGGLQDNNALNGKLGFLMNPKVFRKWQQDTTNQYNTPTPLSLAKIEEISGYKVRTTTNMPANMTKGSTTDTVGPVIFGNWEDLLIPMYGGLEVSRSEESYNATTGKSAFHNRLVHILVTQLMDSGVIRPASFAASNEATTV